MSLCIFPPFFPLWAGLPACAACAESPWRLRTLAVLLAPLALFALALSLLLRSLPPLDEAQRAAMIAAFLPPHGVQNVAGLAAVARAYVTANPVRASAVYLIFYVCMQTYAVPGTILLTLIAAPLFGLFAGFAAVQFCAVSGAVLCYGLSWAVGRAIVHNLWPARVHAMRDEVRGGGRGARTRVGGERRAADDEYNLDQPPETLCGSTISLTEANERRGPPWARPPLPACTTSRGCFFALFLYPAYGG